MHTTQINNTVFQHHGDYSGDIIIMTDSPHDEPRVIAIPFEDLKGFIADYVACIRIGDLERATDDEILGVKG